LFYFFRGLFHEESLFIAAAAAAYATPLHDDPLKIPAFSFSAGVTHYNDLIALYFCDSTSDAVEKGPASTKTSYFGMFHFFFLISRQGKCRLAKWCCIILLSCGSGSHAVV
jgi:hypothetical protein